jgi:hypothetical protein
VGVFEIVLFALLPLFGIALAVVFARRTVLSGRLALAFAAIPYAGAVMTVVWC